MAPAARLRNLLPVATLNARAGAANHQDARAVQPERRRESGIQIATDVSGHTPPDPFRQRAKSRAVSSRAAAGKAKGQGQGTKSGTTLDLTEPPESIRIGSQFKVEGADLETFANLAARIGAQRDGTRATALDAQEKRSSFRVPTHAAGMLADSGRERQVDAERGALSDGAAHFDCATVTGDEFAGDGQAEPGPFLLAREVGLENLADVLGLDTGTVIG